MGHFKGTVNMWFTEPAALSRGVEHDYKNDDMVYQSLVVLQYDCDLKIGCMHAQFSSHQQLVRAF